MTAKNKTTTKEPKFIKDSLMKCERFRYNRDLLMALLKDDVEYTMHEVESMITEYMKGKVK